MKVILTSLILMSGVSLQACKTCYYYESVQDTDENVMRPTSCDPSTEVCTNGETLELFTDYYSENN